ncbi:hypothetical protein NDU88_004222 [Pleurodeles waltl]|uniref:Uncharacterized protein n=1 Tax=Pleurodeles waltl TaxID=8319 RepID=A0AAV7SI69_PLEWA|nr:hypothetical protein NDU88_004222 [Pleurodeles waltl]
MRSDAPLQQLHGCRYPDGPDAATAHSASAAPTARCALAGHRPQPRAARFRAALRRPQSGVTEAQGDSALRRARVRRYTRLNGARCVLNVNKKGTDRRMRIACLEERVYCFEEHVLPEERAVYTDNRVRLHTRCTCTGTRFNQKHFLSHTFGHIENLQNKCEVTHIGISIGTGKKKKKGH